MRRSAALLLTLGALASTLAAGCYRRAEIVDPPWRDAGARDALVPGVDSSIDGGRAFVEPPGECTQAAGVDLLFVIDDSASMAEEQARLAEQIPLLLELLTSPPDDDGDGRPDWLPIEQLQVGVVTTDMGVGGHSVPTCDRADFGDDGVLLESSGACASSPLSGPIFRLDPEMPEPFISSVSCVAQPGSTGCGFEQQLEAALKAVSPSVPTAYTGASYEPPVFVGSTFGHGEGRNAGFVREDSLLAIVIVTDEEDCSVVPESTDVFDPSSERYGGVDLNLRCFSFPEVTQPVERYVDGLLALRASRPDLVALAVLAGIPPETAVPLPSAADFTAMLEHPDMQERVDPETPTRLFPSCSSEIGLAFPPRRLVRTAEGLGPYRATVQSICESDYRGPMTAVARLIGRRGCAARVLL